MLVESKKNIFKVFNTRSPALSSPKMASVYSFLQIERVKRKKPFRCWLFLWRFVHFAIVEVSKRSIFHETLIKLHVHFVFFFIHHLNYFFSMFLSRSVLWWSPFSENVDGKSEWYQMEWNKNEMEWIVFDLLCVWQFISTTWCEPREPRRILNGEPGKDSDV